MPPRVAAEMALHVLAYNVTRVMNIMGTKPLIAGGVVAADMRPPVVADRHRAAETTHRDAAEGPRRQYCRSAFLHDQDPQRASPISPQKLHPNAPDAFQGWRLEGYTAVL